MLLATGILAACVLSVSVVFAEPPLRDAPDNGIFGRQTTSAELPFTISDGDARTTMQWLASMVVHHMPQKFEGEKDWGKVKQVWSGVKIRREGFELKTNRRFRDVNHGHWIRYELSLPTSSAGATIEVDDVAKIPIPSDQPTASEGWRIRSTITAPLQFTARIERWNLGLKWYSVSVSGRMLVSLRGTSTVRMLADYTEVPPAIVVDPHVEQAALTLERFEVDRISKIGGDVAEAWGEMIQEVIRQRIKHKENASLADRFNRSIDQHRDKLRWSLFDATTRWLDASGLDASGLDASGLDASGLDASRVEAE